MASITARITGMEGLGAMQALLDPKLFAKAEKGGIAYAAKSVPPAVAKGLTASYGISSARVKDGIGKIRIQDAGSTAIIPFSRRSPTLRQYQAKPGSRGGSQPGLGQGKGWGKPRRKGRPVTALLLRSRGRQSFPSSFFATGEQGNQLVLRRSKGRLIGVYGPSIGSAFLGASGPGPQLRADVSTRIQEQFAKGYQRVLDAAARGF
jgi:hypothetical protein